jgi:hypothetical protein
MSAPPVRLVHRASVLAVVALALMPLVTPLAAYAQFPDLLSETECPGCRVALLAGTWSSPLTSADDPAWALEDFFCLAACTPEARATATALVSDPENTGRATLELYDEVVWTNARHAASLLTPAGLAEGASVTPTRAPRFGCDPHGFASQVISPLPLEIELEPGGFGLRYEEFGARRTVRLHGAPDTKASGPTPFGVSKARFEDGTLIVETRDVSAGNLYDWFGGGPHSNRLRATERYRTSDDGEWLFLVLELEDPETLREPLAVEKSWRRTPDARIAQHGCDVMSGQLEGVLAEYVDPAKLDARRR